jgi:flagellar protein FlbD
MITLHRLNGQPVGINADLIERVDVTPNTIITLVDGTKYLVAETLDDVVDAVRTYRASIVALSERIDVHPRRVGAPVLHLVAPHDPPNDDADEIETTGALHVSHPAEAAEQGDALSRHRRAEGDTRLRQMIRSIKHEG